MGHRPLASTAALVAVVVVVLFAQAHVAGQVQSPATTVTSATKAWTPPLSPMASQICRGYGATPP
jgi:hypothetical protein